MKDRALRSETQVLDTVPSATGRFAASVVAARRPLLSLLLAAAIPILLFGGWVAYFTAQQDRVMARRAAEDTVSRVAERVAAELATQLQLVEALSQSTELDGPELDQFYTEAERLKESRPLWETVELADPAGTQVLNLLRPLGVPLGPTADRESFDEVLRTRRAAVGGIGPIGPISGKRLVAIRAPVMRGGELRYVLTVSFVPNAISSILREAGAPSDWVGAVVDAKGNIIARTLAERYELGRPASPGLREAIARAPNGFYIANTLEGVEVETVYQTLPGTGGWSVHFGVSSEALNAPVSRSRYVLVGGGMASLVLAFGLSLIMARDMAQRRSDAEARAALALRVSEERWIVAVEAAELGTWRWDVENDQVSGSERCRALLDLNPSSPATAGAATWPAAEFLHAVHADDRETLLAAVRRCLDHGTPIDVEFRAWRNGAPRWVRATGRTPPTPDSVKVINGVIADIEPRKKAEAERLDLLRRLADAQENEQRRIARELHDQVGQTVTGLSLGLKGLQQMLESQSVDEDVRSRVQWLLGLTGEIGRDIHRAAADLRPTALDDLGLNKALEAYASDWSERFGIAVEVQVIGGQTRLPADVETAVYRVVQEGLTNVLKHASAQTVSIVLEQRAQRLFVIVEDDGVGFDPGVVADTEANENGRVRSRLGLSGISERLALVNGTLSVESTPGGGTTLFIQIPLSSNERV